MGVTYADIKLSNPKEPDLEGIEVKALVDTRAATLCVPEHLAVQLKFDRIDEREVTMADGTPRVVAYVGPVQVNFEKRTCFTGAYVLGDRVLMGAIHLEDMVLAIEPSTQRVTVNPKSPNIPSGIVM
jgi:clan AA aspartic protease